ncbi:MAG: PQQ-dependent sugar dehydrogenase [Gemmatimonadales bacterium]
MPTQRIAPLLAVLAALGCSDSSATPGDLALALETVSDELVFPVDLTSPPGDPRLFVAEKGGRIRIIESGAVLPTPFLDLSDRVSTGGEQGLLGLAFDPDYATNGRFIVNYTDLAGDTRISAFRVSADADLADEASEVLILGVDQPFANHNGGQLTFGPDGYLYVGLGDGGDANDPQGNGQSLTTLLGKLLRIDVDGGVPYAIPPDNPFAATAAARAEIWSYGLRNPWRFSFDRLTGDLYIGDVGQREIEEIDVSPAASGAGRGVNYGWDVMEGRECFEPSSGCDQSGLVLPAAQYNHGDGCSVTGGYVYRGSAIPALQGTYFYSDFCSGWVRSFRYSNGEAAEEREWAALEAGNVTSFGQDAAGELYILAAGGTVYRIVEGT